jgi:hypothetical protein
MGNCDPETRKMDVITKARNAIAWANFLAQNEYYETLSCCPVAACEIPWNPSLLQSFTWFTHSRESSPQRISYSTKTSS